MNEPMIIGAGLPPGATARDDFGLVRASLVVLIALLVWGAFESIVVRLAWRDVISTAVAPSPSLMWWSSVSWVLYIVVNSVALALLVRTASLRVFAIGLISINVAQFLVPLGVGFLPTASMPGIWTFVVEGLVRAVLTTGYGVLFMVLLTRVAALKRATLPSLIVWSYFALATIRGLLLAMRQVIPGMAIDDIALLGVVRSIFYYLGEAVELLALGLTLRALRK